MKFHQEALLKVAAEAEMYEATQRPDVLQRLVAATRVLKAAREHEAACRPPRPPPSRMGDIGVHPALPAEPEPHPISIIADMIRGTAPMEKLPSVQITPAMLRVGEVLSTRVRIASRPARPADFERHQIATRGSGMVHPEAVWCVRADCDYIVNPGTGFWFRDVGPYCSMACQNIEHPVE